MRAFCYHVKVFSGTPSYAKEVCRKMESCLGYVLDDSKHLVDFVAQLNSQLKGNPKSKGAEIRMHVIGKECQCVFRKGNSEGTILASMFFHQVEGDIIYKKDANTTDGFFAFEKEGGEK